MCTEPLDDGRRRQHRPIYADHEAPPDWETLELPEPEVLRFLADAHCHPTDMPFDDEDVTGVGLGFLAAMATRTTDQDLVREMGKKYGREEDERGDVVERRGLDTPETVACFGYHPWFCHLLSVEPASSVPSRRYHYSSIFLSESSAPSFAEQSRILEEVLPDLPDPLSMDGLIGKMRENVVEAQRRGQLVMIGEVGLDRSFRVPFPKKVEDVGERGMDKGGGVVSDAAKDELAQSHPAEVASVDEPRKSLMPFRPSIEHQRKVLEKQFELAVELGVNVSLHSVKAQGPTLDFLRDFTKKHGDMFLERVNVDVHSCGGFSVEGWLDSEKRYPNLFLSPSLAISSRTPVTPALIRAASDDRLLVESDTHLIGDTTRRVWAAAVWVAKCKGWEVERDRGEVEKGGGVVARVNANWRRFMRIEG